MADELTAGKRKRPARKQADEIDTPFINTEGREYNIWYGKYLGDRPDKRMKPTYVYMRSRSLISIVRERASHIYHQLTMVHLELDLSISRDHSMKQPTMSTIDRLGRDQGRSDGEQAAPVHLPVLCSRQVHPGRQLYLLPSHPDGRGREDSPADQ